MKAKNPGRFRRRPGLRNFNTNSWPDKTRCTYVRRSKRRKNGISHGKMCAGHIRMFGDGHIRKIGDCHIRKIGDGHIRKIGDGHIRKIGDGHIRKIGDGHIRKIGDVRIRKIGDGRIRKSSRYSRIGALLRISTAAT